MALALCGTAHGQDEGIGHKISIPGRRELLGTISPSRKTKTFVVNLDSGLYRITYFSNTSPAIVQVSENAVSFGSAGPARPMTTIMQILNGQLQKTIDLPPTGLCSSDVARDQNCAGQKLHFRVGAPAAVSIEVSGVPKTVSSFRLLLDPITFPQPDD